MSNRWMWACGLVVALALGACGGEGGGRDPGPGDAGPDLADPGAPDLGEPDLGVPDLPDLFDPGAPDLGPEDEGAADLGPGDEGVTDPGPEDLPDLFDPGEPDPGAPEVEDVEPVPEVQDEPDVPPSDACEGPLCVPCPEPGVECATVVRDDAGECGILVAEGTCFIDGACFPEGRVKVDDPCSVCVPAVDPKAWSIVAELACDDPTPCSTGGKCTPEGKCVPAAPICDDGNPCTADGCIKGACKHQNVMDGSVCDDHDACTLPDQCWSGVCKGTPKNCGTSTDPCKQSSCDSATGNCVQVLTENSCDDNDLCTENDVCHNGMCLGTPKNCADEDLCTVDTCVGAGECRHTVSSGPCEDGDLCTVGETCATGSCTGGHARTCTDNNACTNDTCDPATGCVFTPNSDPCDDGEPCTVEDRCSAGKCTGTPKVCEDGNECTQDTCTKGIGCRNVLLTGTACEDGDPCTSGDRCVNGGCVAGGPNACDDGNLCTSGDCIPGAGCTFAPVDCDDRNPCTSDSCDPLTGCVHVGITGACDDQDPCTLNDQCLAGQCVGADKTKVPGAQGGCSDGNPCTVDTCTNGICGHAPNTGACDDGNACTQGEVCVGSPAQCVGAPVSCNDDNGCTADSCDPATGCVHTPVSGACTDFSVCTTGDQCVNGQCVGTVIAGLPVAQGGCNDGNFCTDDLCDALNGCWYRNNDFLCDDGNACTVQDQCRQGTCAGQSLFTDPVARTATLQFGTTGDPGMGVDVDGDPATCSPKGSCSGGINNNFANMEILSPVMKDQFNPQLASAVGQGRMGLVLEVEGLTTSGAFTVNLFTAQEVQAPATCNPAGPGCDWRVFASDVIGTCYPKWSIDNATLSGSHLSAGGKEYQATVYLPLTGAAGTYYFPIALRWVHVEADVTVSGSVITGGSGVVGGAFACQDFADGMNAVPVGYFSPYTKAQILQNFNSWVTPELDIDGNGKAESCTIGLPFSLVTGHMAGRL